MKFLKRITRTLFRNDENDISMEEAKRMLKEIKESVLIDVRSHQEYDEYCVPPDNSYWNFHGNEIAFPYQYTQQHCKYQRK